MLLNSYWLQETSMSTIFACTLESEQTWDTFSIYGWAGPQPMRGIKFKMMIKCKPVVTVNTLQLLLSRAKPSNRCPWHLLSERVDDGIFHQPLYLLVTLRVFVCPLAIQDGVEYDGEGEHTEQCGIQVTWVVMTLGMGRNKVRRLTHWGQVTPICVSKPGHH